MKNIMICGRTDLSKKRETGKEGENMLNTKSDILSSHWIVCM